MRLSISVVLVLLLLVVANFVQALAVGAVFGVGAWSTVEVAFDLLTRWLAFAAAAFAGTWVAKDRAAAVAIVSTTCALAFGVLAMATSSEMMRPINYASLVILGAGAMAGALSWLAIR